MSFSVFKHVGEGCISGSSSHISSPKRSDSCDTVTEHQRQNREKLSCTDLSLSESLNH